MRTFEKTEAENERMRTENLNNMKKNIRAEALRRENLIKQRLIYMLFMVYMIYMIHMTYMAYMIHMLYMVHTMATNGNGAHDGTTFFGGADVEH